jgi:hypothetical protein
MKAVFDVVLMIALMGLVSCSEMRTINPLTGNYEESRCFKNAGASSGFGYDIYTKATLLLNYNGTGTVGFKLYDDVGCTNLLGQGTTTLHYSMIEPNVMLFHQNKGLPDEQIMYLVFKLDIGIYLDTDNSGPYLTQADAHNAVPSFLANLGTRGVFLPRKM